MANDIYSTTHSGLSTLVSPRVASRVLKTALRKQRLTASNVTAKEMRSLLRGPILKDLTGILPKSGLEHSLHQLSRSVANLSATPGPRDDTLSSESYTPAFELEEGDLYPEAEVGRGVLNENASPQKSQPKVEIAETGETYLNGDPLQGEQLQDEQLQSEQQGSQASSDEAAEPPLGLEDEPVTESVVQETETFQENDVAEETIDTEAEPLENISASETDLAAKDEAESEENEVLEDDLEAEPNGDRGVVSEDDLEDFILQFAQLDHIRMVAALATNGQVVHSRGDGYDLDTLSRLGTLGLKLLSRSGELRSYYLAFKGGQLFFFPLGEYTLCIIGTTELNLGLVFATLHKLKEDV